jgi:hypothetical protein
MLLIIGDVQTLDHRRADQTQLIHDDRVPLLPARRKPGPRRSLNVPDLIAAWHRPSRYRMHPGARRPQRDQSVQSQPDDHEAAVTMSRCHAGTNR